MPPGTGMATRRPANEPAASQPQRCTAGAHRCEAAPVVAAKWANSARTAVMARSSITCKPREEPGFIQGFPRVF